MRTLPGLEYMYYHLHIMVCKTIVCDVMHKKLKAELRTEAIHPPFNIRLNLMEPRRTGLYGLCTVHDTQLLFFLQCILAQTVL